MTDHPSRPFWQEMGPWLVAGSLLLNLAFVAEHIGIVWLNVRHPVPAFVCDPTPLPKGKS